MSEEAAVLAAVGSVPAVIQLPPVFLKRGAGPMKTSALHTELPNGKLPRLIGQLSERAGTASRIPHRRICGLETIVGCANPVRPMREPARARRFLAR